MYVMSVDELAKVFLIQANVISDCLPEGHVWVDDLGAGLLDLMADAKRLARDCGWRNWRLEVKG